MTVLTLSYIELLLYPASFANPMPPQLDLDPGPVMQRHAGQMQVDRGQLGHHGTLARPSHGSSSCLSAITCTTPQPSVLQPLRA
jgi:hypothetical protein